MSKWNVLEDVKVDDVISVVLDASAITGEPILCVETYSEGEIQHRLTNGYEVHHCNEFLRSMNLIYPGVIKFENYPQYAHRIAFVNQLLGIRRIMEVVSGAKYDDMGISAYNIYDLILNRLLAKHHMAKIGYEQAIQKRPLQIWVKEALDCLA